MSVTFDKDLAFEAFTMRYKKYHGKQIDDCTLPAGSPMHYYCNGCETLTCTKPEGWFLGTIPKYCDDCEALVNQGVLSMALEKAKA